MHARVLWTHLDMCAVDTPGHVCVYVMHACYISCGKHTCTSVRMRVCIWGDGQVCTCECVVCGAVSRDPLQTAAGDQLGPLPRTLGVCFSCHSRPDPQDGGFGASWMHLSCRGQSWRAQWRRGAWPEARAGSRRDTKPLRDHCGAPGTQALCWDAKGHLSDLRSHLRTLDSACHLGSGAPGQGHGQRGKHQDLHTVLLVGNSQ